MHCAAHRRVIERFALIIEPRRVDHALVIGGSRHSWRRLGLAQCPGIGDPHIIYPAGQYCRPHLGRERQHVVEFDAVDIGQTLVPIVRVPLHDPDFVLDAADAAKRAGAGVDDHLAQIVVVVLQRLLADDDVPAAGNRRHHEIDRPRFRQFEFHGVFVARVDLADRLEQNAARNADPRRRLGNAVEGSFDVLGGQLGSVVKQNFFAQEEGVRLSVLGDLPAMRQVRDDRLAAVARIAPD